MTTSIKPVTTTSEMQQLETLANQIWREHYIPIIGQAQVDYMLSKFQSAEAMQRQVDQEGYLYYAIEDEGTMVGYFSVQPRGSVLFLSKLYVAAHQRGRGLARQAMDFIQQLAHDKRLMQIELTVNKHNSLAIAAYQKMGFRIVKEAVFDIGEGFVMDDYVMQLEL
jgi:ribosomal protein S18 acetylase RimI-like enzyme